ncbi:MAG: 2,3-diphosphoglycerate-dependent phosphoglycerate mutase [Culicoidibacterales bacterium]
MKLVLIRHGQSVWNQENLFTGWVDVPLSQTGKLEAIAAGKLLLAKGFSFDISYSSLLLRANDTLDLVLGELKLRYLPTIKSWRLNERHYGDLQGKNKEETAKLYGEQQVLIWRRSYDVLPPLLSLDNPLHPLFDKRYQMLDKRVLPVGESLKLTLERVIPFWEDEISLALKSGKDVLVVAHGNSLRALIKYLDVISDDDILAIEIPTGQPIVYELDEELVVLAKYYLEVEA